MVYFKESKNILLRPLPANGQAADESASDVTRACEIEAMTVQLGSARHGTGTDTARICGGNGGGAFLARVALVVSV